MQLTFMSYNIKSCLWTPRGLDAIAERIADVDADVVALQEVDRNMDRSGCVDQARELGSRLGYEAVYAATVQGPDLGSRQGEYGIALLSRLPVRAHEQRLLYRPPGDEQRCILGCTLEHPTGLINVFCTHFGLTSDQRLRQADGAVDFVAGWRPGPPVVLMGDFNAEPGSPEIETVRRALVDLFHVRGITGDARLTFPGGPLGSRTDDGWAGAIDYVFVSRHFEHALIEVIREPLPASDHAPVVVRTAIG